jgi:hypothetical protein
MDFRQTTQNSGRPTVVTPAPTASEHKDEKNVSGGVRGKFSGRWTQILTLVVLVGTAILLACIALAFTHSNNTNEVKYVTNDKYQAVFLNNGQVYFGKVASLNDKYVRMTDVFYLTQSGDSNSSNYSLVKLGCQQIHDPTDQMVINRDQVTFWENLQDNGKVVTSINQFKKQNPNGPDCSQVSNQTQASSSATQGGTGSSSSTNSTTNTTK